MSNGKMCKCHIMEKDHLYANWYQFCVCRCVRMCVCVCASVCVCACVFKPKQVVKMSPHAITKLNNDSLNFNFINHFNTKLLKNVGSFYLVASTLPFYLSLGDL